MSDTPKDITEVEGQSAFYLANGIEMNKKGNPAFPYSSIYDDVFKAIKPYMVSGLSPRSVSAVIMTVAFDAVTTAMALTEYGKDADSITHDQDMQMFMEMLMIMINHMQDGITANGQLLAVGKSIYNEEENKLDS